MKNLIFSAKKTEFEQRKLETAPSPDITTAAGTRKNAYGIMPGSVDYNPDVGLNYTWYRQPQTAHRALRLTGKQLLLANCD